jgi:hypothetical protein
MRAKLANMLGMPNRNVQIWFQNARAKSKKKKGPKSTMTGSQSEMTSPIGRDSASLDCNSEQAI